MSTIRLRKESIPRLLGLLGNILVSGDSEVILSEDRDSDGRVVLKLGDEIIDDYFEEKPIDIKSLHNLSTEILQGYTKEELQDMNEYFYCNELDDDTDRYTCKHLCSLRKECKAVELERSEKLG